MLGARVKRRYCVQLNPEFPQGYKVRALTNTADWQKAAAVRADRHIFVSHRGLPWLESALQSALRRSNPGYQFRRSQDGAAGVAVQSDGKIVVAGGAVINSFNDFVLARFN
jgi:hypothetical protein